LTGITRSKPKSGTKKYCPKLKQLLGPQILLQPFKPGSEAAWLEEGGNAYALLCHPLVKEKAIQYWCSFAPEEPQANNSMSFATLLRYDLSVYSYLQSDCACMVSRDVLGRIRSSSKDKASELERLSTVEYAKQGCPGPENHGLLSPSMSKKDVFVKVGNMVSR